MYALTLYNVPASSPRVLSFMSALPWTWYLLYPRSYMMTPATVITAPIAWMKGKPRKKSKFGFHSIRLKRTCFYSLWRPCCSYFFCFVKCNATINSLDSNQSHNNTHNEDIDLNPCDKSNENFESIVIRMKNWRHSRWRITFFAWCKMIYVALV